MAWLRAYLPENIVAAGVDNASLHIPFLEVYNDLQSDLSMVSYNWRFYIKILTSDQAKVFAERAYELNVAIGPERIQYEQLQQLADIAEGRGDNAQARRYRQMSFRYRMAHSIYPGDPQYNDFAKLAAIVVDSLRQPGGRRALRCSYPSKNQYPLFTSAASIARKDGSSSASPKFSAVSTI